jgi:hypothetical protein
MVSTKSETGSVLVELGLETVFGAGKGVSCKLPFKIGASGPVPAPKESWPGLAAGAAIAGVPLWIGENVCGFDLNTKFEKGKVVSAPELEWRVKWYCNWQLQGYGDLVLQVNPQELLLGVPEYALKHLGAHSFDFRWGNENKKLGFAVRELSAARELRTRGYGMAPDPNDPKTIERIGKGQDCEFQVHANSSAVPYDALMRKISELRKLGARRMSITIPSERATDLARGVKFASEARLDLLTIAVADFQALPISEIIYSSLQRLQKRGDFVPDVGLEAEITSADALIRAFAMASPFVKLVSLIGEPLERALQTDQYPGERNSYPEELRGMLGDGVKKLPAGALGVYGYLVDLADQLRDRLNKAHKSSVNQIERSDLLLMAENGARAPISDAEREQMAEILDGRNVF